MFADDSRMIPQKQVRWKINLMDPQNQLTTSALVSCYIDHQLLFALAARKRTLTQIYYSA